MSRYLQIAESCQLADVATDRLAEVATAQQDEFAWRYAQDSKVLLGRVACWLLESHPICRGRE